MGTRSKGKYKRLGGGLREQASRAERLAQRNLFLRIPKLVVAGFWRRKVDRSRIGGSVP